MQQLEDLVRAIRHQLSQEDRRLLRAAYGSCDEEVYDKLFDRVVDRLKSQQGPALEGRRSL